MKVLELLADKLLQRGNVWAPKIIGDNLIVEKVSTVAEIDWSGKLPANSFKAVFVPWRESLVNISGQKIQPIISEAFSVALGVNILDLQAFTLISHVFEKDPYFQKRRQNSLIIGYSTGLAENFRNWRAFHQKFEEDILEHVLFDVFIERKGNELAIFSGSEAGQMFLNDCGIDSYEHIEFAGLVPEAGLNPLLKNNQQAVAHGKDHPLWLELAKICLACGKCSAVCPTCFCHDSFDQITDEGANRHRQLASCFYPEFTEVAGGRRDLDSIKKRLYFWYYHKFVRIPDELSYYGCVGCGRCTTVCPVEINIAKNLQILKSK